MSIQAKLILWLLALLSLQGLGIGISVNALVLPQVRAIEQQALRADLHRVEQTLAAEQRRLQQVATDWGYWDDTYRYVATPYSEFEQTNLSASVLYELDLDLLLIAPQSGPPVATLVTPAISSLESQLRRLLLQAGPQPNWMLEGGGRGLLATESGILLLGASAILPTNGQGEARGTLYFGKLLDAEHLASLAEQLQLTPTFTIAPPATPIPKIELLSPDLSRAETQLPLLNRPDRRLNLCLEQPRPFYQNTLSSVQTLVLTLVLIGASAAGLLYLILQRGLIRPILLLEHQSGHFARTQRAEAFRLTRRRDELGRLARAFHDMAKRIASDHQALEKERDQLEQETLTDPLTELGNRRALSQFFESATLWSPGRAQLLLCIDLDHFKEINDLYGHDVGDIALRQMAETLRNCSRESDLLVRSGGEEFTALYRVNNTESAEQIAERIRCETATKAFGPAEQPLQLTCSIGFALCASAPDGRSAVSQWQAMTKLADLALYEAKRAGRDTWVGYSTLDGKRTDRPMLPLPRTEREIQEAINQGCLARLAAT